MEMVGTTTLSAAAATVETAIRTAALVFANLKHLAPPITTDQVALLRSDNVVSAGAPGLVDLGVTPTALEAVVPGYLWRYRTGGQYAADLQSIPIKANYASGGGPA